MKYNNLTTDQADRILKKYRGHSYCINNAYASLVNDDTRKYWSDRDRFVKRFFSKYANRYVKIIDRVVYAYNFFDTNVVMANNHVSMYSVEYNDDTAFNRGEPLYMQGREYLCVLSFDSVNQIYGSGYIRMTCRDVKENIRQFCLNYRTLSELQFVEITKDEFTAAAAIFKDDREPARFKARRMLMMDELRNRKLVRKNCSYEKMPTVYEDEYIEALDRDDAVKQLENKYGKMACLMEVEPSPESD